jgi:hypothetical protein
MTSEAESDAERMCRLLAGSSQGHLLFDPAKAKTRDDKIDKKPATKTPRRAADTAAFEHHLCGKLRLGSIPIEGDMALGGVIDVDDYNVSHRDLAEKVESLGLPLIVERSMSGGAHLRLPLAEPIPAARVISVLQAMASALALTKTEIFPKQERVKDGDVGNGIFLPYFPAESDKDCAVGPNGFGLSISQYLDALERMALNVDALATLEARLAGSRLVPAEDGDDDDLGDMEPDEAHKQFEELLAKLRATDTDRNTAFNKIAFKVGSFAKYDLIEAEPAKEALRAAALETGLPASEVSDVLTRAFRAGLAKGRPPRSGRWPDGELTKGKPRTTMDNTIAAIRLLKLSCRRDVFHNRDTIEGHQLETHAGDVTDDVVTVLRKKIKDQYLFDPGKEHVRDAISTMCVQNMFDPVCDYLDQLCWDGVPRLTKMLTKYFGAADTDLNASVSTIVMIGAVRRARHPGSKFDTIMVLEGAQGTGKSTALEILAGEGNFSDQNILTADAKTQMEQVEGKWIYEIAELEGMSRADTEKVKAFASRRTDRARPAYGRFRIERPRRTVFIGTTNNDRYLRDQTGNRRFLPVKTGCIDLESLRRDRAQLWAEAAKMEAEGISNVLPQELWALAAAEQEARVEDDPWTDILEDIGGKLHEGRIKVRASDIFDRLELPPDRRANVHFKRLAGLMRRLGWEGPTTLRFGSGIPGKGFSRSADDGEQWVERPLP